MNLLDAIENFGDWHTPWTFRENVRAKLAADSKDAKLFEELAVEVSRFEHWNARDLAFGC